MKTDALPDENQRKQLCELIAEAFVQLRYLDGEQANDLAYAFHNLPLEMYGWGNWSISGTRNRLRYYQKKHAKNAGPDFVALFDVIYPES